MAWARSTNGRQQTAKTSCTVGYRLSATKKKVGRSRKNWIDRDYTLFEEDRNVE